MIRLRVLAVAQDAATLQTIERAVADDVLLTAMDVAEAIAIAASEKPEIAFVDVALEERAGLALVHHIPAVSPGVFVYAMAPGSEMELGTQAVALGAAGFLLSPPSGDALLQALGDVRARLAEAAERARLEADLGAAVQRAASLERLLGGPREEPTFAATRIYPYAYFVDTATREIEMAKRHQRRLAIAAIVARGTHAGANVAVDEAILGAVRETDVLTQSRDNEFILLLPETGAVGAHACRRRVQARVDGDRRTSPPPADRRGAPRMDAVSIGLATFPHDGNDLARLLSVARHRAEDSARSPIHTLALTSKALPAIVDALLACPMLDAGPASPFPLDLSVPAALSLVSGVCREALRGGGATILVTTRTGAGLASVVRPAVETAPPRVTVHEIDLSSAPGCETADAVVVVAEHGTWTLCGRHEGSRFKAVHCADALVADLLAQRLAHAAGVRLA